MKMRRCKQNGCRNLIPYEDSYCDAHKALAESKAIIKEQEQKRLQSVSQGYRASERHTHYAHSQRYQDIGAEFYQTSKWKKLAERIRVRDLYTCQVCGNQGSIVDHIVMRRADESRAMNADNLWTLCRICHNKKSALEKASHEKLMQITKDDWIKMLKD